MCLPSKDTQDHIYFRKNGWSLHPNEEEQYQFSQLYFKEPKTSTKVTNNNHQLLIFNYAIYYLSEKKWIKEIENMHCK